MRFKVSTMLGMSSSTVAASVATVPWRLRIKKQRNSVRTFNLVEEVISISYLIKVGFASCSLV